MPLRQSPPIDRVEVGAYQISTDQPESDGTLDWDSTTIVVVEVHADKWHGLGYTYADVAAAHLVSATLVPVLEGQDPSSIGAVDEALVKRVRNLSGRRGLTQMALSAVNVALWDLKARWLDVSLVDLLGRVRSRVPLYGSGGFVSYDVERLQEQLAGWVELGIPRVKMKVGRSPEEDAERVHAARKAIGDDAELYVDANGAYERAQALAMADRFADHGVTWMEEPVSSDDLVGLRAVRERAPAGMDIAAGEYGDDIFYFHRMLDSHSVDVIQPDVTRCGGISGFRDVAALCKAFQVPLSAHTAPQLDAHTCAAVEPLRHAEYFHDHVRIEQMLFDGALEPVEGALEPDASVPGHGLTLKRSDAERFLQYRSGT